jgi:hypothetical protein
MQQMTITSAQYAIDMDGNNASIRATIDGQEMFVPLDPSNRHYAEIMRQVEAGDLVIAEAD